MVMMPARCSNCGRVSDGSGGIEVEDSWGVSISNSSITCPYCGGRAQIVEGTFNVTGGGIEMVHGPQWSLDVIDELRLRLVRIAAERPADVAAEIRSVSDDPHVQALADRVARLERRRSKAEVLNLIAALVTILGWMLGTPSQIADKSIDLWEQIDQVIDSFDR